MFNHNDESCGGEETREAESSRSLQLSNLMHALQQGTASSCRHAPPHPSASLFGCPTVPRGPAHGRNCYCLASPNHSQSARLSVLMNVWAVTALWGAACLCMCHERGRGCTQAPRRAAPSHQSAGSRGGGAGRTTCEQDERTKRIVGSATAVGRAQRPPFTRSSCVRAAWRNIELLQPKQIFFFWPQMRPSWLSLCTGKSVRERVDRGLGDVKAAD